MDAYWLTLAVLGLFGAMTRWEPSVLRACAMAATAVLASHLGRPARGVRVLALAVTVLLLADPFLLRSVGFLLSCGASVGAHSNRPLIVGPNAGFTRVTHSRWQSHASAPCAKRK